MFDPRQTDTGFDPRQTGTGVMETQHVDSGICMTCGQGIHAFFNTWLNAAKSGLMTGSKDGSTSHVGWEYCNWRPKQRIEWADAFVKRNTASLDMLDRINPIRIRHKGLNIAFENEEAIGRYFGFSVKMVKEWIRNGSVPRRHGFSLVR